MSQELEIFPEHIINFLTERHKKGEPITKNYELDFDGKPYLWVGTVKSMDEALKKAMSLKKERIPYYVYEFSYPTQGAVFYFYSPKKFAIDAAEHL